MAPRTRLDEIAEEAEAMLARESCITPRIAFKFAAAAGFRHGLDQSCKPGEFPGDSKPAMADRRNDSYGRPGPEQGIHAHLWRDGLPCRFCGAPDRRKAGL